VRNFPCIELVFNCYCALLMNHTYLYTTQRYHYYKSRSYQVRLSQRRYLLRRHGTEAFNRLRNDVVEVRMKALFSGCPFYHSDCTTSTRCEIVKTLLLSNPEQKIRFVSSRADTCNRDMFVVQRTIKQDTLVVFLISTSALSYVVEVRMKTSFSEIDV